MTDNFIEVYYTIKQFNGSELHYCGNSAPVMNGEGWEAKQMQWEDGALYVLWERKDQK
jgi:hypothetical protein